MMFNKNKCIPLMMLILSNLVFSQRVYRRSEAPRKVAFDIESGYSMYGLEHLQKTLPVHIGLGIGFLPENRWHDIIKIDYSQYQTYNVWEENVTNRWGHGGERDNISTVVFKSLMYKKSFRIQKERFSRHKVFIEAGMGLVSLSIKEPGYFNKIIHDRFGIALSGGITYEYVLNKRKIRKIPNIRASIIVGFTGYLPLYKNSDSIKRAGQPKMSLISEYQSTLDILKKKPKVISVGLRLKPRYISPEEYRRRDSISDAKYWDRLRLKDAKYLERQSRRNQPLIDIANASDLTMVISSLPGVNVVGAGADAQIKVRGHISFRGNRDKSEGNHPDAKGLMYSGLKPEDVPNLNYKYDEPVFVVDGMIFNGTYTDLFHRIVLTNVASIKVVKGPETAMYGAKGANGVILIETKK